MNTAPPSDPQSPVLPPGEAERRRHMIAEAAYFRAERRGFEAGYELEDWLAAEAQVDRLPAGGEVPIDPYLPRYIVSSESSPPR